MKTLIWTTRWRCSVCAAHQMTWTVHMWSLYRCFGTNIGRYMRWTEYTARSTYWILWTGLKKMISTDIIFQYLKWCEVGLIGSSSHSRMVLSIASLTGRFHMSRCRSSKESMTAVSSAFTTWSTTIHSHDRCRVKLTRLNPQSSGRNYCTTSCSTGWTRTVALSLSWSRCMTLIKRPDRHRG